MRLTGRTKAARSEQSMSSKARAARAKIAPIAVQISALEGMTVAELCKKYQETFGQPTTSRNKTHLRRKIGYRLQELAEGGLSPRARAKAAELAEQAPIRHRQFPADERGANATDGETAVPEAVGAKKRDPRLPAVGTVLKKTHEGVVHAIKILANGFEYNGKRYTSLSTIAKEVTGTNWNGFLWLGLQKRPGRDEEA
jgi:hypothetical protein